MNDTESCQFLILAPKINRKENESKKEIKKEIKNK